MSTSEAPHPLCSLLHFAGAFESLPSELCPFDKSNLLHLHPDGQIVEYCASFGNELHAGLIRAKKPVPANIGLFYYEVTILDRGAGGNIAVGFASAGLSENKLPGWEGVSVGYHGDDGYFYSGGRGQGSEYGPCFTIGDVVGCGLELLTQKVFFTKNGVFLGLVRCSFPPGAQLFPAIGLRTLGERVQTNFGSLPFRYALSHHVQVVRQTLLTELDHTSSAAPELDRIILNHLVHAGHLKTAQALHSRLALPEEDLPRHLASISTRKRALELVLNGELSEALLWLSTEHAALCRGELGFHLELQQLVEMIHSYYLAQEDATKHNLLLAIFEHGAAMRLRISDNTQLKEALEAVFSLIAYNDPFCSPNGHLLAKQRRQSLAERLNRALLEEEGCRSHSLLELLLRHLQTVQHFQQLSGDGLPALLSEVEIIEAIQKNIPF